MESLKCNTVYALTESSFRINICVSQDSKSTFQLLICKHWNVQRFLVVFASAWIGCIPSAGLAVASIYGGASYSVAIDWLWLGVAVGMLVFVLQLIELKRLRKYPSCVLSVGRNGECELYDGMIVVPAGLQKEIRKVRFVPTGSGNAESTSSRAETLLVVHHKEDVKEYPLFATQNIMGKGIAGRIASLNRWELFQEQRPLNKPAYYGW